VFGVVTHPWLYPAPLVWLLKEAVSSSTSDVRFDCESHIHPLHGLCSGFLLSHGVNLLLDVSVDRHGRSSSPTSSTRYVFCPPLAILENFGGSAAPRFALRSTGD
jgi:hypothetical protein